MGGILGKPEQARQKEIEKQLKKDAAEFNAEVKLLLLGPGESGKSTLAKQMKLIHLGGFSDAERQQFRDICHSNVISTAKALLGAVQQFRYKLEKKNESHAKLIDDTTLAAELDEPLAGAIARVWRDAAVQKAFARYAEFQLSDSAKYYMDSVKRLAAADYVPTDEDILRVRAKTTGITELLFTVEQTKFRLVDVGGQRSERKKWMHCVREADHQILTDRGFLYLDEVEALVVRCARGAVCDWRGLRVATFDAAAQRVVFETPRALVVNDAGGGKLVTLRDESGALDLTVTDGHQMYVSLDHAPFKKMRADQLEPDMARSIRVKLLVEAPAADDEASDGASMEVDGAAQYAVQTVELGRLHKSVEAASGRTWCFDMNDGFIVTRRAARVRAADAAAAAQAQRALAALARLVGDERPQRLESDDALARDTYERVVAAVDAGAGAEAALAQFLPRTPRSAPASAKAAALRTALRAALAAREPPAPRAFASGGAWVATDVGRASVQGNCFDGVTAIVFVVAISEYDLMLYEDQSVRRMDESMQLFDEMCNSQLFLHTPLVLFLNKSDLFREKIKQVDLSTCFPDYKGGADYERACAFTKAKFEALNRQPQVKMIYPHVTCATDTENVAFVFAAVKDTLLASTLDAL